MAIVNGECVLLYWRVIVINFSGASLIVNSINTGPYLIMQLISDRGRRLMDVVYFICATYQVRVLA